MRRLFALALAALVIVPAARAQTGDVTRGRHLYGPYCIACHGANGMGVIGGRSEGQKREGPPLAGVGALAADFYLRTGYMPLHEVGKEPRRSRVLFSEDEIRALVAYVASLGHGPPVPKPRPERGSISEGLKLFTDHCAGCHQLVARGGFVTGARVPPLEDATPTQIAEAVRIGPYVMPTFSERALPARDLDSIVRYIEYAKHPENRGGWALGEIGPVPEGMVAWLVAAFVLVGTCVAIGKRLKS